MIDKWLVPGWTDLLMVAVTAIAIYATIIAYTRLAGLRSFSKMTAPDFAMTVAVGSLFATTMATPSPQLLLGAFGIGTLFLGQWLIATLRGKFKWFSVVTDNKPILLMAGSEILHENLKRTQVTEADLCAKLREANVLNFDQVCAVVFEATGDISVLHSSDKNCELDRKLFEGVRESNRITNVRFAGNPDSET